MIKQRYNVNRLISAIFVLISLLAFVVLPGCSGESDSAIADGEYFIDVALSGGSGKATVTSPCALTVENGEAYATIEWSSSHYDYMKIDGEMYLPVNEDGNSTFEIPVAVYDEPMEVLADTTAMSEPHEIAYTLTFDSESMISAEDASEAGDGANDENSTEDEISADSANAEDDLGASASLGLFSANDISVADHSTDISDSLTYTDSLKLQYATQFSVDYYEGGYALITIEKSAQFLVVPEGKSAPNDLDVDIIVLQQPVTNIYMASSAVMDMYIAMNAMDTLRFAALDADDWYLDEAKEAMEDGSIVYAGKYSAPDYELIVSKSCGLAIENTMIYHNPEVKEKLESFGIPVLVDYSSYESDPIGRMEWVKLHGVIVGCEEEALVAFEEQEALFYEETDSNAGTTDADDSNRKTAEDTENASDEGAGTTSAQQSDSENRPTVAFFYINSAGAVNVRKSDDYLPKMIALAGGDYIFDNFNMYDGTAASTVSMQMEEFYAAAKDADYLIYNSTIVGELASVDDLLAQCELFKNFKAVQENHVYCTSKNLYQSSMQLGSITADIRKALAGEDGDLTYLYHLE